MKYFTIEISVFFISSLLSVDIFFLSELLFSLHICTKQSDLPSDMDPSWSSLEEFESFEDFTAFYIKIDKLNADPMLLYPDQTPAKYLHLSCILSPCRQWRLRLVTLSNSLISSHFTPHKTILILCDKLISVNFGLLPSDLASNRLAIG